MSWPRARPLVLGAVMVAVVAVGAMSTWWAATSGVRPESSPTSAASRSGVAPMLPDGLVEPSAAESALPAVPARAVVEAAERAIAPGMTLGVAVLDVDTGELAEGRNGRRQFLSASLCKLIMVVDMLDRQRTGGPLIDPADLELVGRALTGSDDNAMNVLWSRYDGPGAVSRVAARLGLSAYLPRESTDVWGDAMVTAVDMVRIYQHVLRGMAPQDRAVIVDALAAASAVAADGFEQHFGLLYEGASRQRYAKQAWVPYRPAGHLLHSAGVQHDWRTGHAYAIALLSIQPSTSSQVARDRLSSVAAAALPALTLT